ncbi:MAG: hypothetical protein MUD03_08035 [Pirellula sp.]|nr:hypothetical protein [Pirellula sp.]
MDRSNLLNWLAECTGDDVWSIDYCKRSGIPDSWIRDLSEIYESGFKTSKEVLYHEGKRIHQYRGIRDSDLARRISQQLGYPVEAIERSALSPSDLVRRIKEAVEEG